MAEVAKYAVETRNGVIVSVKDNMIIRYLRRHMQERQLLFMQILQTQNGKNFLYWNVLAGRAVGVSGNTDADYLIQVGSHQNILKAVYELTKIIGDDATLT